LLGLNIITKPGLLVFSYAFTDEFVNGVDMDMQAGFMTSVLNAIKETRGESITAIQQRNYVLIIYEGVLTYGILTATLDDPRLRAFLRKTVLKFELMFTFELYRETVPNRLDFEPFRNVVKNQYTAMMETVDISRSGKLIEIIKSSAISNYIIYETKFLNPVFSTLNDPILKPHIQQIIHIVREIIDLGKSFDQEMVLTEIQFKALRINVISMLSHCLVFFYSPEEQNINDYEEEIKRIMDKLEE
jgi:hypothetical protein